ncbi:hypothetical protein F4810DRAFT_664056 [Camillea tinctor]|nr:hypothetical protein F4810DRAFT_664056 [Camillea tinctor]
MVMMIYVNAVPCCVPLQLSKCRRRFYSTILPSHLLFPWSFPAFSLLFLPVNSDLTKWSDPACSYWSAIRVSFFIFLFYALKLLSVFFFSPSLFFLRCVSLFSSFSFVSWLFLVLCVSLYLQSLLHRCCNR